MKQKQDGMKQRVQELTKGGSRTNFPQFKSFPYLRYLQPKVNWYRLSLTFFLVMGLVSCGGKSPTSGKPNATNASAQNSDSNLTFFGIAFEQFDEVGRPIWKVRAKQAKYTKERKLVRRKVLMVNYIKMAK